MHPCLGQVCAAWVKNFSNNLADKPNWVNHSNWSVTLKSRPRSSILELG